MTKIKNKFIILKTIIYNNFFYKKSATLKKKKKKKTSCIILLKIPTAIISGKMLYLFYFKTVKKQLLPSFISTKQKSQTFIGKIPKNVLLLKIS